MFRTILVPLDHSALAETAIPVAARIAEAAGCGIDFVMVHPSTAVEGLVESPWETSRWKDEEAYLEAIASGTRATTNLETSYAVMRGAPAAMISRRASEVGAGMIVMTSHGRTGIARAILGSVAADVLRRSMLPVLVVRGEESGGRPMPADGLSRMLVLLDGSALSNEILKPAAEFARATGATLLLARVVRPVSLEIPDRRVALSPPGPIFDEMATAALEDEARADLASAAGILEGLGVGERRIRTTVVVDDHVATVILDLARKEQVGLIAMSTHGRGASGILLGSMTSKVLKGWDLPMLVVRPREVAGSALMHDEEVIDDLQAMSAG